MTPILMLGRATWMLANETVKCQARKSVDPGRPVLDSS